MDRENIFADKRRSTSDGPEMGLSYGIIDDGTSMKRAVA